MMPCTITCLLTKPSKVSKAASVPCNLKFTHDKVSASIKLLIEIRQIFF